MKTIEGGQMSIRQAILLLSLTIVGGDAFLAPGLAARAAGQDGVLGYGIAVATAMIIVGMLNLLARRHPGQTVFQMAENIGGSLVGG